MLQITPDPDQIAALAEFAAGAGHEINNPLATIVGRVQQLLRDEADPVRRSALLSIGAQAYRVRDMIGDLMLFARPLAPEPKMLSVAVVVAEIVRQFSVAAESASCPVLTDISAESEIFADPAQFSIVLHELLRNSRQALLPEGGEIRLNVRCIELDDRPYCELTVGDQGRGFSALEARHAFDPFYSGRQAGRGLGFGLCKCFRIAEMHHATLEIVSQLQGPTTVRLVWPANSPAANAGDG